MKKALMLVLVLVLAFSVSAFAGKKMVEVDDGTPEAVAPENIISINALSYLIGFANISYERKIFNYVSVRVRVMDWLLINSISSGSGNFFGFGGDVFVYPMGKACSGWFLGPRFDTFFLTVKSGTDEGTWNLMTAGGTVGYRWTWAGGFEMGIGVGAYASIGSSYTVKSGTTVDAGTIPVFNGISPGLDYEIGWAF